MKRFGKLCSLAMALLLLLTLTPVPALAANVDAKITGTFCYSYARVQLDMVNAFRTGSEAWYWNEGNSTKTQFAPGELGELVLDANLEQIAMERARELALYFDHVRPNGELCMSLTVNGIRCWSESIARGFKTPESVISAWREDNEGFEAQGHRRNMLNPRYTAVGFGCFYHQGVYYWTQEFGYSSNAATTQKSDDEVTGYVTYSTDLLGENYWSDEGNCPMANYVPPTPDSSKPVITTQPKSVSAAEGATATFTVAATGATSYQWQWRNGSSGTWTDSTSTTTGYNTKTLKVSATAARSGYQYRCKVSNSSGTTYSNIATLTVLSKPAITTQPKSVSVAEGGTATFTVAATGATSYQWQWRNGSSGTWADSTSATTGYNTKTLKVSAASHRNGYQYRCKVSNSAGTTYTNIVTLTVVSKPAITTQPKSVSAAEGGTATFTVAATGATSYQWQWRNGSSGTWTDSTSATTGYNTKTLKVSAASHRNGYQYRCAVSNSNGTTYTNIVTLTVRSKPAITTQPKSVSVAEGGTAAFTVAATGATSNQWQWRNGSSGTWADCTSATTGYNTATLKVSAASHRNGYQYRCLVSNASGEVFTNIVTLTVK